MTSAQPRINQPVKVCISIADSVIGTGKIWTDKYKDSFHILLQSLDAGFVVALGFFPVKRPEWISTAVETTYHVGFCARIIGDRTFGRVFIYWLLPLWWRWGVHTRIRVYHMWCMSVCARLNLAVS
jgi:hypothetical protein